MEGVFHNITIKFAMQVLKLQEFTPTANLGYSGKLISCAVEK